jgi:hypothetical protein
MVVLNGNNTLAFYALASGAKAEIFIRLILDDNNFNYKTFFLLCRIAIVNYSECLREETL